MLGPIRQTFPAKFADKIENSFSGPTLRSMWRYHPTQADAAQIPQRMLCIWVLLTAGSIMFSARQDYYTLTAWGAVAVWLE